jgi:hypothetical protein
MNQNATHKTCKTCRVSKLFCDFYLNEKGKFGLRGSCRECFNKSPHRDLKTLRDAARSRKIGYINYLGGSCIKCGYCIPEAIDFHHIDPSKKKFEIGAYRRILDDEDLKKELQKCAPLCRNCHAEFHAGRFLLEPYLHKIPKFNENTKEPNPIGDELILGLQISFVD